MTGLNDEETELEETDSSEESGNRAFLIIAGCLGLLTLLSLVCLGGFLLFGRNTSQQANLTAPAQATQQAATIDLAIALTQTAVPQPIAQTAPASNTVPPTNTPVIAQPTLTASPMFNPATSTVGAAFTQAAVSTQILIATSTALPNETPDLALSATFSAALVTPTPFTSVPYNPPPSAANTAITPEGVTDTPTPSPTSLYQPVAYVTDRLGGYSPDQLKTGNIRYQYPSHMEPETSGLFSVSILIPIDKLNVVSIPMITTPSNTPKPLGSDYTTWEGELTVAPTVRVELTSLDFKVQAEFPEFIKAIDMAGGYATSWSWSIKSSSHAGVQILYLKVYLGDAKESIWDQSITIDVQLPTATPSQTPTITFTPSPTVTSSPTMAPSATPTFTPTATPIPRPQQIINVLINNSAVVFGSILTFITALLGFYFLYLRPKDKDKDKDKDRDKGTRARATKRKRS